MSFTDLHASDVHAVVDEGLDAGRDELFVINPAPDTIRAFVTSLWSAEDTPAVKLFAEESTLKTLLEDFRVASRLADLVDEDRLAVRTLDTVPRMSLFLTDRELVSIVENGEGVAALSSEDGAFVDETYAEYSRRWERSPPFSLRTPPLTRVRETMAEEIGNDAVEDFNTSLSAVEQVRGDSDGLDEVTIALLVAANNRVLLYDISRWGEDVRLASKATFSREKNRLESEGIIGTEKVPIEMGRPRLRLVLGDQELVEEDIETVIDRAQKRLG